MMNALMGRLARWPVIAFCLLWAVALGFSFSFVMPQTGGTLMDMLPTGAATRDYLAGLTAEGRSLHLLATLVLDTLYPLTLAGFLAGIAGRMMPDWQGWIGFPALVALGLDLAENLTQALALAGIADGLDLKDWLTPMKFQAYMIAAAVALAAVLFAGVRRFLLKP